MQLKTKQYHAIHMHHTMKYHVMPYLGRLKPQLGQTECILAHCNALGMFLTVFSRWIVPYGSVSAGRENVRFLFFFFNSEGAIYVIMPYDYPAQPLFEHTPVLNNNFEYYAMMTLLTMISMMTKITKIT